MEELLANTLAIVRQVAPYLTGGLAGAVVTYLLNRRLARVTTPRLQVRARSVNYTLAQQTADFSGLEVSFEGTSYQELSYHEFRVENISRKMVRTSPFILAFAPHSRLLKMEMASEPLRLKYVHDQENLADNQHRFTFDELHPGDTVTIRILVAGGDTLSWIFRGADDVEVLGAGGLATDNLEEDFKRVAAWIALYVLVGVVPLVSAILQAGVIMAVAPYMYRLVLRLRGSRLFKAGSIVGPVVVGDHGRVRVDFNPETGASSVSAEIRSSFDRRQLPLG